MSDANVTLDQTAGPQTRRRVLARAVVALAVQVAVMASATAAWSWPTCD